MALSIIYMQQNHRNYVLSETLIMYESINTTDLYQFTHACFQPNSTIKERIAYYHACCFSPALSTWCQAIDAGHFTTWPELTSQLVRQHTPTSIAMHKGHLESRPNPSKQRSTKAKTTTALSAIELTGIHL